MGLVVLNSDDKKKIQIDEGIVVIDFGEITEKILGPTRGGVEVTITPSIRDIEFDGRKGKTKGMQLKDGEDVSVKVKSLCCSLESLKLAIPGATIDTSKSKLTPGSFGIIPDTAYLKNLAVVTKMLDGTYTIIKVLSPMHEGAFSYKGVQKNENEHSLDFLSHYDPTSSSEENIWDISTATDNPLA